MEELPELRNVMLCLEEILTRCKSKDFEFTIDVEGTKIRETHQKLIDTLYFNKLMQALIDLFLENYANIVKITIKPKKVKTNVEKMAMTIIQWYNVIPGNFAFLKSVVSSTIIENINDSELLQLFHSYGYEVFKYAKNFLPTRQVIGETNIECEDHTFSEDPLPQVKKDKETELNDKNGNGSEFKDKYDRAYISFGGGCLSLIRSLHKNRVMKGRIMKLTNEQIRQSRVLWNMSWEITMKKKDKQNIDYSGMQMRDEGGYQYPRNELKPFLKLLNSKIRDNLNENGISKYGRKIIRVVVDNIFGNTELLNLYLDICRNFTQASDNDLKAFYKEWTRKITHATINEYLTARDAKEAEAKKTFSKGSSSLRDQLYIQAKSQKNSTKETYVSIESIQKMATTNKCKNANKSTVSQRKKAAPAAKTSQGKTKNSFKNEKKATVSTTRICDILSVSASSCDIPSVPNSNYYINPIPNSNYCDLVVPNKRSCAFDSDLVPNSSNIVSEFPVSIASDCDKSSVQKNGCKKQGQVRSKRRISKPSYLTDYV